MTDKHTLVERLEHCSANTRDEYLHELTGRAATRITALEAREAELVEASNTLARYTTHNLGCALYQSSYAVNFPSCSCGLDHARATLAKHQEGEG